MASHDLSPRAVDVAVLLVELTRDGPPLVERRALTDAWRQRWPESDGPVEQTAHRTRRRLDRHREGSAGSAAGVDVRSGVRRLDQLGVIERAVVRGRDVVVVLDPARLAEIAATTPKE